MAEVRMDEARYFEGGKEGEEDKLVVVQARVPGTELRPGNVYYEAAKHHGGLSCRFCDAAVHHSKGSRTICGDNLVGQSPHFRTNPGVEHSGDCKWPERAKQLENTRHYNPEKGYKIHLNTSGFAAQFNDDAGQVYERDEDRRIVTLNQDLFDREPRSIKALADLMKLIKEGNYGRLNDSVVVHHDHVLPWRDFMVRYDHGRESGQKRFRALIERIREHGPQPCMMEFNVASGVTPDLFGHVKAVKSATIDLGTNRNGQFEQIFPRLYVKSRFNTLVTHGFMDKGAYLVMGYANLKSYEDERSARHILSMDVTAPEQFAHRDLASLVAVPRG